LDLSSSRVLYPPTAGLPTEPKLIRQIISDQADLQKWHIQQVSLSGHLRAWLAGEDCLPQQVVDDLQRPSLRLHFHEGHIHRNNSGDTEQQGVMVTAATADSTGRARFHSVALLRCVVPKTKRAQLSVVHQLRACRRGKGIESFTFHWMMSFVALFVSQNALVLPNPRIFTSARSGSLLSRRPTAGLYSVNGSLASLLVSRFCLSAVLVTLFTIVYTKAASFGFASN
jgi:hypothetical protein